MRVYTLRVDAWNTDTAKVASRALAGWLKSHGVGYRGTEIDYHFAAVHFVAHSDPYAEFCATIALRECGLGNNPAELRLGVRTIRTQRGIN